MKVTKIYAKSISYGGTRSLNDVKAIVIHNTGNKNDLASSNANFFKYSNTRMAGAHYFIDQKGNIVLSIPINKIAYAVGGSRYNNYKSTGGGKYYGIYNNANTVSIELCDIVDKEPSEAMIKSVQQVIASIKKKCPNATKIIRHFDVTGKSCPIFYLDNKKWEKLLAKINNIKSNKPTLKVGEVYELKKDRFVYPKPNATTVALTHLKLVLSQRKKDKDKNGTIDKGSSVKCREIKKNSNGNIWMRILSGWILVYDKKKNKSYV